MVGFPGNTLTGIATRSEGRVAIWSRRGFLLLLVVLVLAGLTGLLGVRTTTTVASAGGYHLEFRYATTARAGLDVPWEVTLTHAGGFDHDVRLAITGDYFDVFETQGFTPEPAESTRDRDTLYLTFSSPPGDTLRVSYDAYIQPSSQVGRDGTLSVLEDGAPVASVDFSTRLLP